jgi:DNA-binding response OmpR family regulator
LAKLLIVEDDDDIAFMLAYFMESLGHEVSVARNGLEGLQKISQLMPDLILLDIEMPQMTGPEMALRLLIEDAGKEKIPLVVLSGVMGLDVIAQKIGTPYYLIKPCDLNQLEALLDLALEERKAPEPPRR